MVFRANSDEDKALKVLVDGQRIREKKDSDKSVDDNKARAQLFPDGVDHLVMVDFGKSGGGGDTDNRSAFSQVAANYNCQIER
jgi:hypothetical protein